MPTPTPSLLGGAAPSRSRARVVTARGKLSRSFGCRGAASDVPARLALALAAIGVGEGGVPDVLVALIDRGSTTLRVGGLRSRIRVRLLACLRARTWRVGGA